MFQVKLLHYGRFVAVLFQEVEELNVGLQGKVELAKRRIYMAEIHRCFVSKSGELVSGAFDRKKNFKIFIGILLWEVAIASLKVHSLRSCH